MHIVGPLRSEREKYLSLMPAEQYRIEFNVTEKNRKNLLFMIIAYFSISDNRIERV